MNHTPFKAITLAALALAAASADTHAQTNLVNLNATRLELSSASVKPGQKISFSASFKNDGRVTLNNFRWGIFMSRDSKITASDSLVAGGTVSTFRPGRTRSVSGSFDLTTVWPKGNSYAGLFVDWDNRIKERTETDNTKTAKMLVAGIPDVYVSRVNVLTLNPQAGKDVKVEILVGNVGNTTAGGLARSVQIGLFVGNRTTTQSNVFLGKVGMILKPGARQTHTFTRRLPASIQGVNALAVVADYEGHFSELSEQNNRRSVFITAQPIAATARRIEWIPRLGTMVGDYETASTFATKGGRGDMAVVAPAFANGTYLCIWSCSETYTFDVCSELSMSLVNSSIMPGWFGTLDSRGRAFPRLALPPLPRHQNQVYTHAMVSPAASSRIEMTTAPIRLKIQNL